MADGWGLKAFVAYVVASVVVLACSPKDDANSAAAGGSGGGAGTASAGASSAGSASGGANSAGSASGGANSAGMSSGGASGGNDQDAHGTVQFGRLVGQSGGAFQASARFYVKDAASDYDCTTQEFGACRVVTCTPNNNVPTPEPSAGTISLSDGKAINFTLTATPGDDYTLPSNSGVSVSGGEAVTVTASGATVPAFTATVAVPKVITINSPTLDGSGVASAPRGTDLVLTFDNRAADGETGTQLTIQSTASVGSPNIYCELPTETGSATIPAAALSQLSPSTTLLLITTRTKQVQAGDYTVSVIAYFSATNPAKTAPATIHVQ